MTVTKHKVVMIGRFTADAYMDAILERSGYYFIFIFW